MRIGDWSSDVCSSDLGIAAGERDDRGAAVDHHADLGAVDIGVGIEMRIARPPEPYFAGRTARAARRGRPPAILALFGRPIAVIVAARSEEHTSELQSLMRPPYAVFCLKKKTPQ